MKKVRISVVVPVYNEQDNIKPLHKRIKEELQKITPDHEVLFVDDGSTDRTLKRIRELMEKDRKTRVITFWRNFGKANALSAGFKHAGGELIFTMDGDLQDDPSEFKHFIKELDKGYDVVTGWKYHRKDPLGKKLPSKLFNHLIRRMTGVKVHDANCGFKLYRREVVEMVDVYGEFHRYIPIIAHWRGFRVGEIKVKHHRRRSGRSKYGLERLFKGFMDLFTIAFLSKWGRSPFYLFSAGALLLFLASLAGSVWTIIDGILVITGGYWIFGLGSFTALLSSIIVFMMGFTGELLLSAVGNERITKNHYRIIER
ncbi:MAG: glycosyltransferase family 2 protein [Thermoplasmatota archaeon]